jgi:hypothetical protein
MVDRLMHQVEMGTMKTTNRNPNRQLQALETAKNPVTLSVAATEHPDPRWVLARDHVLALVPALARGLLLELVSCPDSVTQILFSDHNTQSQLDHSTRSNLEVIFGSLDARP